MNSIETKGLRSHGDVLRAIAEAIDIPDHMDKLARDRYESIGKWLDREDSAIRKYKPEIFPQGSFLIGTAIRPIGDADEYDIDLACRLNATKHEFTMKSLKDAVGKEIHAYAAKHGMSAPKNSRRCWTLPYADAKTGSKFHIDILPSLPDEDGYKALAYNALMEEHGDTELYEGIREHAIAITDKTHHLYKYPCNDWPVSNPRGYAIWFRSRQMVGAMFVKRVHSVPIHDTKTILQRVIQLLKRHRDIMFNGDEDKPISIIITTLAALAYNGEQSLDDAISSILVNMGKFIVTLDGKAWIPNPINPTENFADKWSEAPQKKENFYLWLDQVQRDFGKYISTNSYTDVPATLQKALSTHTMARVLPLIVQPAPSVISSSDVSAAEVAKVKREEGGGTRPWCR